MKSKQIFIITAIVSLLLYGICCLYMAKRFVVNEQKKVANHAKIVSESLWSFDPALARNYLNLASQSDDYKEIVVLTPQEEKFLCISSDIGNPIDKLLEKLSFIRTIPLTAEIKHNGNIIGRIQVKWYNRTFYIYLYILLVQCLLLTILWFFLKTVHHKSELANQVKIRTNELLRLTAIIENTPDLVAIATPEKKLIYMNAAGKKMFGWEEEQEALSERKIADLHPEWAFELIKNKGLPEAIRTGSWSGETAILMSDGSEIPTSQVIISHKDSNGEISWLSTVIRDISASKSAEEERIKLQEQLIHSQKMDAVGQLAGGIAHDFNNLLTAIIGATDLLTQIQKDDQEAKEYIDMISSASLRASKLVQGLLTFSRKSHLSNENFNIHESIQKVLSMLERTIDKNITVTSKLNAEIAIINSDQSLIENALLNLCINARDAMPDGGHLTVSTKNVDKIDKSNVLLPNIEDEKYIEVKIKDTGVGISSETQKHIFEPFYTTKDIGKGTGLGLSLVYQTIKDNDGSLDIESELGQGTVLKMYFPIISEKQINSEENNPEQSTVKGHGLILVIEDEEIVRKLFVRTLKSLGYDILTANDGEEGVKIYRKNKEEIDLVLLDLLMPKMNGEEAFYALKEMNPDVKVIITSGFSQETNIDKLIKDGALSFIKKPCRKHELSNAIQSALKN